MKPRQQRMLAVGLAALGIAIAAGLTLKSFEENMMFFVEISDVVAGEYPKNRNFRIGGLVVAGSITRDPGSLEVKFKVTDTRCTIDVVYVGVTPDLFLEGQGVVAHGSMGSNDVFAAEKSLPSTTKTTWRRKLQSRSPNTSMTRFARCRAARKSVTRNDS